MQHIETVTVGVTPQSAIQFLSIAADFTDLLLVVSARSARNVGANDGDYYRIKFNGSTSGFSSRLLIGTGSTTSSVTDSNFGGVMNAAGQTASTFSNGSLYIANYTSNVAKSFSTDSVVEANVTAAEQVISAGLWTGTAPITSLEIYSGNAFNFLEHTTASLYGITAGSDGIVTVS